MLPLLFAFMVVTAFKNASSSSWDMVEVLLAKESKSYGSQHDAALDDFHDLFDEFAYSHGLRYNRNFRELETYGVQVAKYGLRNTNCEEFRQFLSGNKAQKYRLLYAAVRCGAMTFSYCMAFSCPPFEFHPRGGGGGGGGGYWPIARNVSR